MKNIEAMTDDEIERSLERYRDLLAELDWADPRDLETPKDFRKYLAGKIRMLEGERERREERRRREIETPSPRKTEKE